MRNDKSRIPVLDMLKHQWDRIMALLDGVKDRVSDLEDGAANVIESITLNGVTVPPDANKNVALSESDPTVPAWAKQPTKPTYTAGEVGAIPTTAKGAAGGVAELDSGGKVPSSQLPSYVDDVLEYASKSAFPATGEAGKIYVALDTNLTYRWSGSAYVEISQSLALGETDSTAYRGDRGKIAYDHAAAKGNQYASGFYLIQTNAEGHVIAATPITKADITALGIPAQDTTYSDMVGATSGAAGAHGLVPAPASADREKFLKGDGTWATPSGGGGGAVSGVKGDAESSYRTGNVNLTPANLGAQTDVMFYIGEDGGLCQYDE